jgi:predicted GIY-YIG superfamily endonuclease
MVSILAQTFLALWLRSSVVSYLPFGATVKCNCCGHIADRSTICGKHGKTGHPCLNLVKGLPCKNNPAAASVIDPAEDKVEEEAKAKRVTDTDSSEEFNESDSPEELNEPASPKVQKATTPAAPKAPKASTPVAPAAEALATPAVPVPVPINFAEDFNFAGGNLMFNFKNLNKWAKVIHNATPDKSFVYVLGVTTQNAYAKKHKILSRQVYIGQTDDLATRLQAHRTGNTTPTIHLQPVWLIGALEVPSTDVALGFEAWLEARKDGENLTGKGDAAWKDELKAKFKNLYTRNYKATSKDLGAMYIIEKAANWRKKNRNIAVELEIMKDQGSRLNIAARMMTRLLRLNLQNNRKADKFRLTMCTDSLKSPSFVRFIFQEWKNCNAIQRLVNTLKLESLEFLKPYFLYWVPERFRAAQIERVRLWTSWTEAP